MPGGVSRAEVVTGRDLEEEWLDLTDSGMLDSADTLPVRFRWGGSYSVTAYSCVVCRYYQRNCPI